MNEKETLEIIRSIQTSEDFKEKKDALLDSIEKLMNSNLDTLKKLQSSGLSKDELEPELTKFQQHWKALGDEIEPEFTRLDTIPGIEQYAKELQDKFFKRMGPIAMEGEKIMMMLGLRDSSDVSVPSPSGAPPSDYQPSTQKKIERQKLNELDTLYGIKSIDELQNSKDLIIDTIGDSLKDNVQKLQSFKNRPKEEYMAEFQEIQMHLEVFGNEMECEFNRLKDLPDGAEYIESFQKEMIGHLVPILDEIDDLREELRK